MKNPALQSITRGLTRLLARAERSSDHADRVERAVLRRALVLETELLPQVEKLPLLEARAKTHHVARLVHQRYLRALAELNQARAVIRSIAARREGAGPGGG